MSATVERLAAALADRYRIERELGAGGMATVYLAHDLKHDRKVAIKVLRPELSAVIGAERFLREIRTIANLQHPHVLGLIDSGEVNGTAYYVMPFVEGESLRDRLTREKQLPIADALRLATEVAGALDYAHRHGIIHRDIKPENILLHDGRALVADFGIALAASNAGGSRMTETGMSLGTPHYMSPEQAMGQREITARSDVYALGVVTYEMLTGDPPFSGSTAQAIVARVMTEEPRSLTLQRKTIPPHVEAAVLTALEKLPADRFATAAEFAAALTGRTAHGPSSHRQSGFPSFRASVFSGALLVAVVLAVWGWWRPGGSRAPGGVVTSTITLPDSAPLAFIGTSPLGIGRTAFALSPDGAMLAYAAQRGAGTQLYLRPMDRDTVFPVAGTEGACCPFFSPDGAWLAFLARDQLSKVRIGFSGSPIPITAVNSFFGAGWGDDGWIVIADLQGRRAARVNAETGVREDLRPGMYTPSVLPGARGILSDTILFIPAKQERRRLLAAGTDARYAASGHITYAHQGALWAVPFDLSKLEVTGEPLAVLPHLRTESSMGKAQYAFARNGLLVYVPGGTGDVSRLVTLNAAGRLDTLPFEPARHGCVSLSPDGTRLAALVADGATGEWDVWVFDLARATRLRLTSGGRPGCPSFSPDGRVTYVVRSGDTAAILAQSATGRESPATVAQLTLDVSRSAVRWAPDGKRVLVYAQRDSTGVDVLAVELDGTAVVHPVAETPALEWGGIFSPDGR
ncbi:MAG TPA: protein kinase, partial [Gemmatimonadales bacterium]|nr:protein kinase [Gemmatimonadales bacterium]